MYKRKLLFIISGVIILLLLALHFIPFDNRTGYIDEGIANLCFGYSKPVDYTYRWVSGGVNAWDDQLSYLHPKNPGCAQPAHIRLYIL